MLTNVLFAKRQVLQRLMLTSVNDDKRQCWKTFILPNVNGGQRWQSPILSSFNGDEDQRCETS